jgi:hypothetical protein
VLYRGFADETAFRSEVDRHLRAFAKAPSTESWLQTESSCTKRFTYPQTALRLRPGEPAPMTPQLVRPSSLWQ